MRKISCPHCGSEAAKVVLLEGKPYCRRCGWNSGIVLSELSLTIKGILAVAAIAVILAMVTRLRNANDAWAAITVLLVFAGLPGCYAVAAFLQRRKLKSLSFLPPDELPAFSISEISPTGAPIKTVTFKEREFPDLAALRRPRKLKMTGRGRFYVVFALCVVILFTSFALPRIGKEFRHPSSLQARTWLLLVWPVVVYGYAFAFFRNRLRERRLVATGELATGFVIVQNNEQYGQSVQYCFKLAGERLAAGRCKDPSRSLYEGMTVAVFYDPNDPAQSIPLDCSMTKLAM